MNSFAEPLSLDEAEKRMQQLYLDAAEIEAQLGDRHKLDSTGQRLPLAEYNAWRQRAKYALTSKRAEYKYLKDWHRAKSGEANWQKRALTPALANAGLLGGAYLVIYAALKQGFAPDAEQQAIIDAVRVELAAAADGREGAAS